MSGKQGNFAELARFRAEADPILAEYLKEAPKNVQYKFKTTQNELVSVIGDKFRSRIVSEVKEEKFYSIIAYEVIVVNNKEELSLVVRYLHKGDVKEDILEVERITGEV